MRCVAALLLALTLCGQALAEDSVHDFKVASIDGEEIALGDYRGKVLLIVNTASRCGFTPQYKDLEALYTRYKDRGLVVLGFPCNDFGGQEPGSETEIKAFCQDTYEVSFPLFSKVRVRGADKSPLYEHLIEAAGEVRWNFTKFLVDVDGKVVRQFPSATRPLDAALIEAVEAGLPSSEQGRAPASMDRTYRLADYFPLRADRSYTYTKTVARSLGRTQRETLTRQPRWIDRDGRRVLRVEDSEGEFQDFSLEGQSPALDGQSMRAQGFVQSYDPPIAMLPKQAAVGVTQRFASRVRHQTRRGTQLGRLVREVTLEGVEDVTTAGGSFRGCLRLKIVSRNSPNSEGSFLATSEETVWLAPGVGEVKSLNATTLSTAGVPWMRATITLELRHVAELL